MHPRRIAIRFDFAQFFDAIHGSELDGTRSDKGELLAFATAREGIDPLSAVMVGDRRRDVFAAKRLGMASVAVLYGYGTHRELADAGADRLARTPADLPTEVCARDNCPRGHAKSIATVR